MNIATWITIFAFLVLLGGVGVCLRAIAALASRMPPTQFAEWAAVVNRVANLEEQHADLHDRFVGFHRRSLMRENRAGGARDVELLQEALAVAAKAPPAAPPAPPSPAEVKARLRSIVFK